MDFIQSTPLPFCKALNWTKKGGRWASFLQVVVVFNQCVLTSCNELGRPLAITTKR